MIYAKTDADKILRINGLPYLKKDGGGNIILDSNYVELTVGNDQISRTTTENGLRNLATITISGGHQIGHETGINYLIIDPSGIDIDSLDGQHKGTVQIRGNLEVLGNTTIIFQFVQLILVIKI